MAVVRSGALRTVRALVTIICLLLLGAAYARGWMAISRRRRRDRSLTPALTFVAAWIALVVALSPFVDALTDRSFAEHMVQHELLMVVVAPLLVLGQVFDVCIFALPRPVRRGRVLSATHALATPARAFGLHALAIWLWHLPAAFDAAESHAAIHAAQHLSFLGTGVLFWMGVLRPRQRRARGVAILALFLTAVHTSALGALIAMSRTVLSHAYAAIPGALGDQQLAGLIMWIPGNAIYLVAALYVARKWIVDSAMFVNGESEALRSR